MPRIICSLNIDYTGEPSQIRFQLIASIMFNYTNRYRQSVNVVLTPEGTLPTSSFDEVFEKLFKKCGLRNGAKKTFIRRIMERRFDELSEMIRTCMEDGVIKNSDKKSDRYILVNPSIYYYRKYLIFKDYKQDGIIINFYEEHPKQEFKAPSIYGIKYGPLNKSPKNVSKDVSNDFLNDFQNPFGETISEAFHKTISEAFHEAFNEAFNKQLDNDLITDSYLQEPLGISLRDYLGEFPKMNLDVDI